MVQMRDETVVDAFDNQMKFVDLPNDGLLSTNF